MTEETYYFNAYDTVTEKWTTTPQYAIDNILTNYASTTVNNQVERLTGNTCPGTNLGVITKVEIRAYAKGDGNDELYIRAEFVAGAGENHITVPGTSGDWTGYQDITDDTNNPSQPTWIEKNTGYAAYEKVYGNNQEAQTFTPSTTHNINLVSLRLAGGGTGPALTIEIQGVNGNGHPDGNVYASGSLGAGTYGGTSWYNVDISPSYELQSSTTYALVIYATGGGGDIDNFCAWYMNEIDIYANGNREYSSDGGSSWDTDVEDFGFKEGYSNLWSWSDVLNLDCDIELDDTSKGNTMYCAKVELRITYTPIAPPVIPKPTAAVGNPLIF